jgi:hypothetical protein
METTSCIGFVFNLLNGVIVSEPRDEDPTKFVDGSVCAFFAYIYRTS